jgi:hypothetical protein
MSIKSSKTLLFQSKTTDWTNRAQCYRVKAWWWWKGGLTIPRMEPLTEQWMASIVFQRRVWIILCKQTKIWSKPWRIGISLISNLKIYMKLIIINQGKELRTRTTRALLRPAIPKSRRWGRKGLQLIALLAISTKPQMVVDNFKKLTILGLVVTQLI